ncbi:hypothetical protein FEM48_Zijuj10G0048900 [Ziziphus jujuba var. spinosa]|uniref:Uncharacterized protein n=1 Tax=Ziziphus jujuba var. spinosa TaxID=714518 RepID=A0A978ULE7_ZIZJJ|nr:hypothetical protein FEM48_Zijuj10G0048900 [Ziziphus jujuba var. spinosa]
MQSCQKIWPCNVSSTRRCPNSCISSAESAKVVLKVNDLNSCSRPQLPGALTLTYNYQDVVRKRVQSYRSIREEEVDSLINLISESSSSATPVNLTEMLFSLTASIVFRIAFRTTFKTSGFNNHRFHQVVHDVEAMLEATQLLSSSLIAERTKTDHEDVIDVLLKLVREQTGFGAAQLSQDNIKAVLLLEYLKMIVKETFRLHPPAAILLPGETISQFKVNGFEVHPKTIIHINAWAIGQDPGYWKSPEEFIPEWFVDSSIDFKGQHFELLPFGYGRRVCPGMYVATTMVELGLANLLYWFDWKLPDGMKEEDINMEEEAGISLAISKKIALNLVPTKYFGKHQKID